MVDRPSVADHVLGRFYDQPQWVFEPINRFRIPTVSHLFFLSFAFLTSFFFEQAGEMQ